MFKLKPYHPSKRSGYSSLVFVLTDSIYSALSLSLYIYKHYFFFYVEKHRTPYFQLFLLLTKISELKG